MISKPTWYSQYLLPRVHLRVAPTQAVRHDLSRGLPTRKPKPSGYLHFVQSENELYINDWIILLLPGLVLTFILDLRVPTRTPGPVDSQVM